MSRRHAYRLMESCEVIEDVKCDQLVTPINESQTRPLARHGECEQLCTKTRKPLKAALELKRDCFPAVDRRDHGEGF